MAVTTPAARPFPLPALEPETRFYWEAGADSVLRVQRCACGRYQHPPLPRCPACGGDALSPEAVSGRGLVASFTVNHQPWRPGLPVPYIFAAVELAEQAELHVFTNIVDCVPDALRIGSPVTVTFEQAGDVWLPLFRPASPAGEAA